jgi:mRNA interferase RelE/StbE|tara:strand:+ start:1703 stop:1954 length:252 start_codon:yes stop_codon:yes gene_type:complete
MHEIFLEKSAKRFLDKLDDFNAKRITKKLKSLEKNPKLGKPLIGNLSGLWKLRIGKYRVIYKIIENKLFIFVLDIGHRKNIYD